MSDDVFPSLPGLKWNVEKTPLFSTRIQTAVSGKEYAVAYYLYPLYRFDLSYEVLRDDTLNNELKTLMGYYLTHRGSLISFLYIDPSFNKVAAQPIGAGDGITQDFQLVRTYGGWVDICKDIQPRATLTPIEVYCAGVVQDHGAYTVDRTIGIVHFTTAPGASVAITATFSFYHRVRFFEYGSSDSPGGAGSGFVEFCNNLWELQSISFRTRR